jgi:Mg2+ and Co2+ transporter CorA
VEATIFDGTSVKPCSLDEAKAAATQPGIAWIDIRLQGNDDADATAMLQAVGVDPAAAKGALSNGQNTDFALTSSVAHGACWLDDCDGSPAIPVYFQWNQLRLVTVRSDGDAAIAQVRSRIIEREDVITKEPATLLGVVLQLMLATVQQGLMRTTIAVGTLDMEIIATQTPQPAQTEELNGFRQSVAALALRFPMYLINVQSALIDPGTVAGLDDAGMSQLQQFLASAQATNGLITDLVGSIRSAAQDVQAQVSTWQGNRINVLTIVTMIFLPITFLTGYFGMNFTWLDNQLNSFWSWLLLGLALPIVLVVVCIVLLANNGYDLPRFLKRKAKAAARTTATKGS